MHVVIVTSAKSPWNIMSIGGLNSSDKVFFLSLMTGPIELLPTHSNTNIVQLQITEREHN